MPKPNMFFKEETPHVASYMGLYCHVYCACYNSGQVWIAIGMHLKEDPLSEPEVVSKNARCERAHLVTDRRPNEEAWCGKGCSLSHWGGYGKGL